MTAAVGLPTLRLVRWSMEDLDIKGFQVGEIREYGQEEIYSLLRIDKMKLDRPLGNRKGNSYGSRGNKNRR